MTSVILPTGYAHNNFTTQEEIDDWYKSTTPKKSRKQKRQDAAAEVVVLYAENYGHEFDVTKTLPAWVEERVSLLRAAFDKEHARIVGVGEVDAIDGGQLLFSLHTKKYERDHLIYIERSR